MNLFNLCATGNLTDKATSTDFPDSSRTVYNFTVAVNFRNDKTTFLKCNYWTKTRTEPLADEKKTLLDLLTKGTKVAISANEMKISSSQSGDKIYQNVDFNISSLDLL